MEIIINCSNDCRGSKNVYGEPIKELVRCKECKFYNTTGCQTGYGWCENPVVSTGVYDEWYCADGERKNDGET